MTTNRSKADGPARPTIAPRSWPRPPGLALLGLALYGLVQAGCRSDGCSTCGFGNALSNGIQNGVQAVGDGFRAVGSVFHHKKGCGGGVDCGCGGGIEEGVVVEQGIPFAPGGMAVPVVPGAATGTIVPPPIESEPLNLKPLPESSASPTSGTGSGNGATTTKPTTSRSSPTGNAGSNYSTSLPRSSSIARRRSDADQALAKSSSRSADLSGMDDLLESMQPVDLPTAVTRKAAAAPASTVPNTPPAAPSTAVGPAPAPAAPPAEKLSAADGASISLPTTDPASLRQAPGLRRYASVAPTVAGGSAPSIEGLDWLKEKGYRTLLDLRRTSEVDPNFVDAASDRGMLYISLPLMANRLDASRLARFDDLIARTDNRPLFFCDTDGTRAALAWYIHDRVVNQEDSQSALAKAEELGLSPAEVKLAEDFLASQRPRAKSASASSRVAMAAPSAAEPAPAAPAPATATASTPPALPEAPDPPARNAQSAAPLHLDEATPSMLPGESKPQASNTPRPDYRDPSAWKPVAALVLTGIGVPLAFWSRTMLSEFRHGRRQASLPGAKRRSLDAPAGSDA